MNTPTMVQLDLKREPLQGSPVRKLIRTFTPVQLLSAGFAFITLAGAVLLALPAASTTGESRGFLDSLFMATSGISTSGLAVLDLGRDYTFFGQAVQFMIFQIGGIGFMPLIFLVPLLVQKRISLSMQATLNESTIIPDRFLTGNLFKSIIVYTLIMETVGALVLMLFFSPKYSGGELIWTGLFHSVSAFCTAGFGLWSDSMMQWRTNPGVNMTINVVSLLGGLGFFVLYDCVSAIKNRLKGIRGFRFSEHTKLVFATTFIVVTIGAAVILVAEPWGAETSPGQRVMDSVFTSVSASTTDGFNSLDTGTMSPASLFTIMGLMFVGASPGSTGGGIKTTTFALIVVFLISQLRRREGSLSLFKRRVPPAVITKALGIFTWFILIICADLMILTLTEKAGFLQIMFEVFSALGNTGLSMGITGSLSDIGKIMLIITMFIGRLGPLAIGFALVGKQRPPRFGHPTGDFYVG